MADLQFSILSMLTASLISSTIAFVIFALIYKRFINERIRLIYGLISNKAFKDKDYEKSLKDDVFGTLEKDSQEWITAQMAQIEKLEERATFRREFLGSLAHELKTPVFSIQGYILTLLEGGLEDEKVNRDFLERALNGVDRISAILEDLDEIAKYEFDRYSLKKTEFDLAKVTKRVFEELEKKAVEKHIKLKFAKDYDSVMVFADEGKIAQVLTNLIANSIAYGNENGKTIVKFEKLDKTKWLIEVSDNGMGIAEKHLPRLFERFYRVDKSRARNVGGSGLGLAIVKHIVEAHGESIRVRSTEGEGSAFSFTLSKE